MFDVSLIYASIIGLIDTTNVSASANRISKLNFFNYNQATCSKNKRTCKNSTFKAIKNDLFYELHPIIA